MSIYPITSEVDDMLSQMELLEEQENFLKELSRAIDYRLDEIREELKNQE